MRHRPFDAVFPASQSRHRLVKQITDTLSRRSTNRGGTHAELRRSSCEGGGSCGGRNSHGMRSREESGPAWRGAMEPCEAGTAIRFASQINAQNDMATPGSSCKEPTSGKSERLSTSGKSERLSEGEATEDEGVDRAAALQHHSMSASGGREQQSGDLPMLEGEQWVAQARPNEPATARAHQLYPR